MAKDIPFDTDLVRELAKLIADTGLSEIEVEKGDLRIRVARNLATAVTVPVVAPAPSPASGSSALPAIGTAGPARDAVAPAANHPGTVPSPMVGTAYLQAEPGSPAFVKVGDPVTDGQTILIIEAMKTMNQIPAPRAGRVKRILVEDGSPVEFGAPLIILE